MDASGDERTVNRFFDRRRFLIAGTASLTGSISGCGYLIRGKDSDADPLSVAEDPDSTRFIGEIAGTWGTRFSQVQSVGLVTNLKETGSDPPADELRTRLINEMKINKVMNPNEILADPSTSLVVVRGWLPPGIQKGDSYDIEVVVPPRSKTASLRDGTLMPTQLRRTERRGGELHQGHVSSSAAGAILVDSIFSEESESNESRGRILGGGVAVQSRPIGLYIRDESGSVSASLLVASAINRRFDTFKDGSKTGVATPKDNRIIELLVPRAYRLNIGRYLAVIRNLPFRESNGSRQVLMTQLESELREPVVAEQAAKKLEALGEAAVPILLRGLTLDNSEIRFYAAESLAYMGEVQAASVLGEIAATSPAFRWHAITALASMDDVEAGVALSNLLHHPNIETRYGSFRAMFARSPQDPTIAGKRLSSFYLHSVVSDSEPFVHFSRVRRPEIVVFGHDQRVRSGFLYVGQGLTVKAIGEGQLDITLYGASGGDQKVVCSDRVSDLIETLSGMGVTYGKMLAMFRTAEREGQLHGKVAVHAVPNPKRRYDRESTEGQEAAMHQGPLPDLFNDSQREREWQTSSGTGLSEADLEMVDGEEKVSKLQQMGDFFKIKKRTD